MARVASAKKASTGCRDHMPAGHREGSCASNELGAFRDCAGQFRSHRLAQWISEEDLVSSLGRASVVRLPDKLGSGNKSGRPVQGMANRRG